MQNNISHIKSNISEFLDYFTHLYNSGASYNVLNSSKSVFSHVVFLSPHSSILEHPQIIKYFRGVHNLRPRTQKITFVWDVKNLFFDYFSHKRENFQLSDKNLTQKPLILLVLQGGGQRTNMVYFFTVGRMTLTDIGVTFLPNHVLKHSKPGKHLADFHLRAFHNKHLRIADCLKNMLSVVTPNCRLILKLHS